MLLTVIAALFLTGCASGPRAAGEETAYILSLCTTEPSVQSDAPFRPGRVESMRCVDSYPSCKTWLTSTQGGEEVARPAADALAIETERSCRAAGRLFEGIDDQLGPEWSEGGAEEVGRVFSRRPEGRG